MEKIRYWLTKLGILRSASYSVKGAASKLNEVEASDGGMLQSQKEIDDAHVARQEVTNGSGDDDHQGDKKQDEKKPSGLGMKITFWIFVVLGILFLLIFWSSGWTIWTFLGLILWVIFLFHMYRRIKTGTASMTFFIIAGVILVVVSFIMTPTDQTSNNSGVIVDSGVVTNEEIMPQKTLDEVKNVPAQCDGSNSEHKYFHNIEKTIVSLNPCEVPWILAKEAERYSVKTKSGTTLHAIVWQNYKNNTEPAESLTIRVLDIDDTQKLDQKAGIAVVRWVPNKSSLNAAKEEIQEIIADLEY